MTHLHYGAALMVTIVRGSDHIESAEIVRRSPLWHVCLTHNVKDRERFGTDTRHALAQA